MIHHPNQSQNPPNHTQNTFSYYIMVFCVKINIFTNSVLKITFDNNGMWDLLQTSFSNVSLPVMPSLSTTRSKQHISLSLLPSLSRPLTHTLSYSAATWRTAVTLHLCLSYGVARTMFLCHSPY